MGFAFEIECTAIRKNPDTGICSSGGRHLCGFDLFPFHYFSGAWYLHLSVRAVINTTDVHARPWSNGCHEFMTAAVREEETEGKRRFENHIRLGMLSAIAQKETG